MRMYVFNKWYLIRLHQEPTDTISGNKLEFMATLGHTGKFDPAEESISVYLEHMELSFAANNIKDEK